MHGGMRGSLSTKLRLVGEQSALLLLMRGVTEGQRLRLPLPRTRHLAVRHPVTILHTQQCHHDMPHLVLFQMTF